MEVHMSVKTTVQSHYSKRFVTS